MANLFVISLSSRLAYWIRMVSWLMWTKHSKDDEFRGKRYMPVFCWVSHNIKDRLLKPFPGSHPYTLIYFVKQHSYLCLICTCSSKTVQVYELKWLIMGEFLISSVIARNWHEVLQLLVHEMLVCQGNYPTSLELLWTCLILGTSLIHKNYIICIINARGGWGYSLIWAI